MIEYKDLTVCNGLIPVIIQDNTTYEVLMLGYMNEQAFNKTIETNTVTFYSRTRECLWVKGETSGNYLHVVSMHADCDSDTLLIKVNPIGNTCHTGSKSCFSNTYHEHFNFINKLNNIINDRITTHTEGSYTLALHDEGLQRVVQKVGEEALEVVIAAISGDKESFINEYADLEYHMNLLLHEKNISRDDINKELYKRHKKRNE